MMAEATKVFIRDGLVGIVTKDEELLKWGGHGEVCVIPEDAFRYVQEFVYQARPALDALMNNIPEPGQVLYWELNIHDKIADNLYECNCEYSRRNISNALWALGY